MSAKAILVFCAQALLIQIAFSQCTSRAAIDASGYGTPFGWAGANLAGPAFGYNGLAAPYAYDGLGWAARGACDGFYPGIDFTATSGGGLPVQSISPISPVGISVISDNIYEGPVSVFGEMPFVSAVVIEGVLPTAGAGAVNHACGNGMVAMLSEGITPGYAPGPYGPAAYGPAAYGPGFGPAAFGPAGFAPAAAPGRFGFGGCGCGMLY